MSNDTPLDLPLGSLIVDVVGTSLSESDREVLSHPLVGGVILFTRNFESTAQLAELNQQIHAIRTPALAICVDQEGGRVQRFKEGFTPLPASSKFGQSYRRVADSERDAAYQACHHSGWLMAAEMRAVGVDFSFAPVVDLDWNKSEIIGSRSFHRNPYAVCDLAAQYIAGMHQAGMKSVIKHFPGHGYVSVDSHVDLPEDPREYEQVAVEDMVPFEQIGQAHGEGLMTAHVVFPKVDSMPTTFSPKWLQQVLRDQLNFQGVVFSDDLNMQAARGYGSASERVNSAFQAGCDVALLCNNRPEVVQVLEEMSDHHDPVSSARLSRMRGEVATLSLGELKKTDEWKEAHDIVMQYVAEEDVIRNLDFDEKESNDTE